jgi:hypothetical protein
MWRDEKNRKERKSAGAGVEICEGTYIANVPRGPVHMSTSSGRGQMHMLRGDANSHLAERVRLTLRPVDSLMLF